MLVAEEGGGGRNNMYAEEYQLYQQHNCNLFCRICVRSLLRSNLLRGQMLIDNQILCFHIDRNALQHITAHYNTLQRTTTYTPHYGAITTHDDALQRIVAQYNTL